MSNFYDIKNVKPPLPLVNSLTSSSNEIEQTSPKEVFKDILQGIMVLIKEKPFISLFIVLIIIGSIVLGVVYKDTTPDKENRSTEGPYDGLTSDGKKTIDLFTPRR